MSHKEKQIDGTFYVSRMTGTEKSVIGMRIHDPLSGGGIVIEFDPAHFAIGLTSMSSPCRFVIQDAEHIGKRKINEQRSIVAPLEFTYTRDNAEQWLRENYHEDGWQVDAYLGGQFSMRLCDGGVRLNFTVYKYVEETDVE